MVCVKSHDNSRSPWQGTLTPASATMNEPSSGLSSQHLHWQAAHAPPYPCVQLLVSALRGVHKDGFSIDLDFHGVAHYDSAAI